MARARTVRPEFFTDEKIGELPYGARLLFEGLWCHSDLRGVFEYSAKQLRVLIFPFDEGLTSGTVLEWLQALQDHGMVASFEAGDPTKVWGHIVHWLEHQPITSREVEIGSVRPAPPGWIDPVEWTEVIKKAMSSGRIKNKPRSVLEPTRNYTVSKTVTKTLTKTETETGTGAGARARTPEASPPAVPAPPDMFEGMDQAPPAVDGTVPKGFQDWRYRKLLGINSDDSSLAGWEALYRRQGWDEMTKGYLFVMKSKRPGQKCWLNDLLKLEE